MGKLSEILTFKTKSLVIFSCLLLGLPTTLEWIQLYFIRILTFCRRSMETPSLTPKEETVGEKKVLLIGGNVDQWDDPTDVWPVKG